LGYSLGFRNEIFATVSESANDEIIFQEKFRELDGFIIYNLSRQPQKFVDIVEIAVPSA
jgi:hypothetical protein